jgi:hypothetical protein
MPLGERLLRFPFQERFSRQQRAIFQYSETASVHKKNISRKIVCQEIKRIGKNSETFFLTNNFQVDTIIFLIEEVSIYRNMWFWKLK